MFKKLAIITTLALALGSVSIPRYVVATTDDTVSVEVESQVEVSADTSSTASGEETSTSPWKLFVLGVRERLSLLTTFDPVKKAEKALKFAEERTKIAEKLAEKADDPKVQERLDKVLKRAASLEERADSVKDRLLDNPDARKKLLLKNLLNFKEHKEEVFSKLEEKLNPEQVEKLKQLHSQAEEKSKALLNALENENLPEEIREHLEGVKAKMEENKKEAEEFRGAQQELIDRIKSGDEAAKEELQTLREDRAAEIKVNVEERVEKREQLKENLKVNASTTRPQVRPIKNNLEGEEKKVESRSETRPQVRPILPLRERPQN